MKYRQQVTPAILLVAATSVATSTAAFAAPTVSGNQIQLPDDGWYQVQNADNYTEVCSGVRTCDVVEGNYIVINHTTGERFNDISVSSNSSESTLNTSNANAVIRQAFEVFSGKAYDRRLTAYPYVIQSPSVTPASNALGDHFYYKTLACENIGAKTENIFTVGEGFNAFTHYDTTYNSCSVNGEVLNGRAILSGDTCCQHGYKNEFSNDFSVSFGDGGKMELSGEFNNSGTFNREDFISVDNFDYSIVFSGGSLIVSDATTLMTSDEISGSFTMSPPVLSNQAVSVIVDNQFDNHETETKLSYSVGTLRITAPDSEIILEADNGDDKTVLVTVTANGESTTVTESWSTWLHALSFLAPTMGQDVNIPSANGNGTLINANSYPTVLDEVFEVMTGGRFRSTIFSLPSYTFPEHPGGGQGTNSFLAQIDETCDNGGTAELLPFQWGFTQSTSGWRSEFTNCQSGDETFNGHISTRDYGNFVYFSEGLTVTESNGSQSFEGHYFSKGRADRGDSDRPILQYKLENVYLDSTFANDPYVLSEANYYRTSQLNGFFNQDIGSTITMAGGFSLSSNATQQNTIVVRIPDRFVFDFSIATGTNKGLLHIDAGNGNEMYLDAETGDEATYTIRIYQPGQPVIERVARWENL